MQRNRHTLIFTVFILLITGIGALQAQPGYDLVIKKPAPYENRELKSEKSGRKKFSPPRRFMQNTTTHYNYFFNSSTKLNEILTRAKDIHKDNYDQLLSFYNYSLDVTRQDSAQLDSVIYKTKTGIVMHDLRNDWIDDLYLLWGSAYYFKKQYDSAYGMFQFINYAFAEKEKDGYYKYIGSRMDGNTAASISTKEKEGLARRLIADPPSRNTAFIWQVRTLIQQGNMPEAASLMATLKNDPLFPKRLQPALEEVQSYFFYKQQRWDSAAFHLVNALDEAVTKGERARWEYLAGQLFERSNLTEQAQNYYTKSISHTIDPVMDIYARLNLIRINKEGGDAYVQHNIDALLKMARRDKYENYRDVIYAVAAQMEAGRGHTEAAQELHLKSARYKGDESLPGGNAFLQLADLSYTSGKYRQAASFYDSIRAENLPAEVANRVTERKKVLAPVAAYLRTIERQDSLQALAALPEDERKEVLKKIVRQLRKQQGLKDEGASVDAGGLAATFPDPFQSSSAKGDWYFYNASLKVNGAATFKQTWGARPNVDNWRRYADVTAQLRTNVRNDTRNNGTLVTDNSILLPTFDALLATLPLTAEQRKISDDSIQFALLRLGDIYVTDIEDYPAAVETYESLRTRFPKPENEQQILFNLYYSYLKVGNTAKAAEIKKLLQTKFPADRYTAIVSTGKDPISTKPSGQVTKTYEAIYDLFLEGKFAQAIAARHKADSTYNTTYWQPQLLYIEAVYYIKQGEDSTAKRVLSTLMRQNAGTPIGAKAGNLFQVLSRRRQIEAELTALQTDSLSSSAPVPVVMQKPLVAKPLKTDSLTAIPAAQRRDSLSSKPKDAIVVNKPAPRIKAVDTTFKNGIAVQKSSSFSYKPDAPHLVVIILNKVDNVFGNEARNGFSRYNQQAFYNQPFQYDLVNLNDSTRLLLIGSFPSVQGAVDYVLKAKPVAGSQIVPWLKGDKYSFSVISADNLELLKTNKNLNLYQRFLEQSLPVKF